MSVEWIKRLADTFERGLDDAPARGDARLSFAAAYRSLHRLAKIARRAGLLELSGRIGLMAADLSRAEGDLMAAAEAAEDENGRSRVLDLIHGPDKDA